MTKRPAFPHATVLMLGMAVLLNYIDRASLATAAPLVQDELSLSATQIGVLLSAFFWVYAPAQILAGWLVHRFDIRVVLGAGVALWSLATLLTGFANGFTALLLLRLLLGAGESVTFPSWQLMLARHTAEHDRGRANGFIGAGQGVGPMLGTLFGGLAMVQFGWRAMFIGLGLITFLWLWPWVVVTRRQIGDAPAGHDETPVPYLAILSRREFWGAALGHFAINYAFYFVMTWLPSFLVKGAGFTVSEMAGIGAAIFGIYAATTALGGVVSDAWVRRGGTPTRVRKAFVLTGALGVAVTTGVSALVEPRTTVWLLGAAGVFFGLATSTMFAITGTLAGSRAAGRWAGAQNVAGQLAGVVAPIVTGVIVDRTGAFTWAFACAAAAAVLAMAAWGILIPRVAEVRWGASHAPAPPARLAGAGLP